MFNDCIIMAGGSGTRLWPASSSRRPKQFLPVSAEGKKSFLLAAIERALALIEDDGRVIVIAGKAHIPLVIESCAGLSASEKKHLTLIPEPEAKNTAPAIACGIMYADWASGCERNMLVLTSDHIIQPLETFMTDASAAAAFAQQDKLVVFGIPPAKPETGYGYIEAAKLLSSHQGGTGSRQLTEPDVYSVAAFIEKPDRKTAEQFVASKRHYWNSGMFAFSSKFMIDEYRRLAHDMIRPFQQLRAPDERSHTVKEGLHILENWKDLDTAYRLTVGISFDYAIAEKCSQVVMIRAGFDWIDIGNWEEYARLLGDTGSEVYVSGGKTVGEKSGNFVDSDIPVALAGVDDLIVVIRSGRDGCPPAALITKKGETQHVRHIVEQIKKSGRTGLL